MSDRRTHYVTYCNNAATGNDFPRNASEKLLTSCFPPEKESLSSAAMSSNDPRMSSPEEGHSAVKKSSIFGTSSNLVNTIVGAGIIGIPFAIKNCGLVVGVILLLLVGYLTDKSLRILVSVGVFHPRLAAQNVRTFEELMSYPFGQAGRFFLLANMFVMAYGPMVAYLLIIKDTVPTILGIEGDGAERELIMVVTSLVIMLPLSLQKDMASLAITSLLSVTADIILVGFVLVYSPVMESIKNFDGGFLGLLARDSVRPTLFIGLGILSTAMACQQTAFIVYGSLENGTLQRWSKVTNFSIGTAASLSVILGVSGYLGYLDETEGDVLNNFEPGSIAANGARALLAITMFFTYPMESFVGRHVLLTILNERRRIRSQDDGTDFSESPTEQEEMMDHRIHTVGLYMCSLLPAVIFDDLGPVLSITGAIGGSCVSYIAPGIIFLGVNGDEFLRWCLPPSPPPSMELPPVETGVNGHDPPSATLDLPVEGRPVEMTVAPSAWASLETGQRKPWWWIPLGFPLWTRIAAVGAENMRHRLSPEVPSTLTTTAVVDPPNTADFVWSIFFIVFGSVALVAGLASNIYVIIMT